MAHTNTIFNQMRFLDAACGIDPLGLFRTDERVARNHERCPGLPGKSELGDLAALLKALYTHLRFSGEPMKTNESSPPAFPGGCVSSLAPSIEIHVKRRGPEKLFATCSQKKAF